MPFKYATGLLGRERCALSSWAYRQASCAASLIVFASSCSRSPSSTNGRSLLGFDALVHHARFVVTVGPAPEDPRAIRRILGRRPKRPAQEMVAQRAYRYRDVSGPAQMSRFDARAQMWTRRSSASISRPMHRWRRRVRGCVGPQSRARGSRSRLRQHPAQSQRSGRSILHRRRSSRRRRRCFPAQLLRPPARFARSGSAEMRSLVGWGVGVKRGSARSLGSGSHQPDSMPGRAHGSDRFNPDDERARRCRVCERGSLAALHARGHEVACSRTSPISPTEPASSARPIELGPKLAGRTSAWCCSGAADTAAPRARPAGQDGLFEGADAAFQEGAAALLVAATRLTGTIVWAEWGPVPTPMRQGPAVCCMRLPRGERAG